MPTTQNNLYHSRIRNTPRPLGYLALRLSEGQMSSAVHIAAPIIAATAAAVIKPLIGACCAQAAMKVIAFSSQPAIARTRRELPKVMAISLRVDRQGRRVEAIGRVPSGDQASEPGCGIGRQRCLPIPHEEDATRDSACFNPRP